MRYGHMAWPNVKDIDKDKIVILPLGSCEQHGPHMPLLDVDLSKHVISLSTPFTAFLPTCAANRPQLASPQKGEALFGGILEDLLGSFGDYRSWKEHRSNEDMGIY